MKSKENCNCQTCRCTPEEHCGCLAKSCKGTLPCKCGAKCQCGDNCACGNSCNCS